MAGGYIYFEKLTQTKLKRLMGFTLQVAGVNVEVLYACLHGSRQIQEAWVEVENLQQLIHALRLELESEVCQDEIILEDILPTPSPSCNTQEEPLPIDNDNDNYDGADNSEEVTFIGDVDKEGPTISHNHQSNTIPQPKQVSGKQNSRPKTGNPRTRTKTPVEGPGLQTKQKRMKKVGKESKSKETGLEQDAQNSTNVSQDKVVGHSKETGKDEDGNQGKVFDSSQETNKETVVGKDAVGDQSKETEDDEAVRRKKNRDKARSLNVRPCVCEKCGVVVKHLRQHLSRHCRGAGQDGVRPVHSCQVCGKLYKLTASLKAHMKLHEGKSFMCSTCGKQFRTLLHLSNHMKVHSEVKPYVCNVCNKSFRQSTQLQTHTRTHTGERPWMCSICGKSFASRTTHEIHMAHHTGERPFPCSQCGHTFAHKCLLARHMRRFHSTDNESGKPAMKVRQRKFPRCIYCRKDHPSPKACLNADNTKTPADADAASKHFSCSQCEETFFLASCLDHHMMGTHKSYMCKVCNRTFAQAGNMYRHKQAVHAGIRRFKCEVCGQEFGQKISLNSHMWTHRTDKRFTCNICGQGYNEARALKNHVKKHGLRIISAGRDRGSEKDMALSTSCRETGVTDVIEVPLSVFENLSSNPVIDGGESPIPGAPKEESHINEGEPPAPAIIIDPNHIVV